MKRLSYNGGSFGSRLEEAQPLRDATRKHLHLWCNNKVGWVFVLRAGSRGAWDPPLGLSCTCALLVGSPSHARTVFSGPFVVALEYATDRAAVAVGKPERTFFAEAMRGFSCEPREIVMIGDVRQRPLPESHPPPQGQRGKGRGHVPRSPQGGRDALPRSPLGGRGHFPLSRLPQGGVMPCQGHPREGGVILPFQGYSREGGRDALPRSPQGGRGHSPLSRSLQGGVMPPRSPQGGRSPAPQVTQRRGEVMPSWVHTLSGSCSA